MDPNRNHNQFYRQRDYNPNASPNRRSQSPSDGLHRPAFADPAHGGAPGHHSAPVPPPSHWLPSGGTIGAASQHNQGQFFHMATTPTPVGNQIDSMAPTCVHYCLDCGVDGGHDRSCTSYVPVGQLGHPANAGPPHVVQRSPLVPLPEQYSRTLGSPQHAGGVSEQRRAAFEPFGHGGYSLAAASPDPEHLRRSNAGLADPSSERATVTLTSQRSGKVTAGTSRTHSCTVNDCPSNQEGQIWKSTRAFLDHVATHTDATPQDLRNMGLAAMPVVDTYRCYNIPKYGMQVDCGGREIKEKQRAAHNRDVHERPQYPCKVQGCRKSGDNGFTRPEKLKTHAATHGTAQNQV